MNVVDGDDDGINTFNDEDARVMKKICWRSDMVTTADKEGRSKHLVTIRSIMESLLL